MKMSTPVTGGPCWAELGTSDIAAAQSFYGTVFGWRMATDPRAEAGGYTMARLGEAAVAALTPLYQKEQPTAWTVSFATNDTDATATAVTDAGGALLTGPMDVFEEGRFAVVADPEGAVFSLWQGRSFAGAELLDAPGALGWVELLTRDPAEARRFYTAVFGWSVTVSEHYTQWGVGDQDFGGMLRMLDERFPPEMPAHWLPYFEVTDVDATAHTASGAGGGVLLEPTRMEDGLRFAVLHDPQRAAFGVHTPPTAKG
ncbi:VOC family protein [Streptomyces formicae]|uniref:VOC family protein n=1 Tax=Streptomyces formicae TaxID=1616117 RepID=A0ABY3WV25_9ACTN|nr:VOC family protein [Streptomyces formicae]UNM16501.1 VOC family protein [Streptomyces formicae]